MVFAGFRENRPFEVNIDFWHDFGANLAPFSFPKSMKIEKKSLLKGIYFLIDFCIDFFSILAPSCDPSWGHVGHIFAQNGGAELSSPLFFVVSMLFYDFWAALAPSRPHFGSILEGSGLHFGGFWRPFFHIFVRFGEAFVRRVLAWFSKHFYLNSGWGWAGGVTRSAKNWLKWIFRATFFWKLI